MTRATRGGAARWTLILSAILAAVAAALTWHADAPPVLVLQGVPRPVLAPALAALFLLAEQFLMNVEFRRQAHSLTLAGVPLVLGVLLVPPQTLVIARVSAAMIAFLLQRINVDKMLYNGAAYACEAALDATIIHLWLQPSTEINLWTAVVVMTVIAGVDQLMSLLVLSLIRLHNGPLSGREIADVLVSAAALSAVASSFALIVLLLLNKNGALGAALVVLVIAVGAGAYRGHASTRRRHQALTLIHEFVSDGVGAESLEQLAGQLLSRIRQLLRAATVEVMIVDGQLQNLATATPDIEPTSALTLTIGEDEMLVVGRRTVDYSDWIAVRALVQEEPTLAARTTKDRGLRRWLIERGVRDAVVVALPLSSGSAGTLTVMDRLGETATFVEDDLTLLQTLTGHLAVAIRSTRLVEKLGYDATHDSLTGLSNRAHLSEQITSVLTSGSGSGNAAVLLLDLDRFKEVNDILGHDVGDRLLKVVADRLRGCLPGNATVARLGGDEFAVLLPNADNAAELAELVADTLAEPVQFEEAMLTPESSVGVAITSTGVSAPPDLLRQADTAMYEAKANDRRVAVYGPDMDRGRIERLALVADLRMALSEHPEQMLLHYQPKIDLHTGLVTGVEALVRWAHPTLGVLGPDRFIPLAESTGLIEGLTPLVLEAGLAECRTWTADGYPISVAVNLSARNISDPLLPDRVAAAIARVGLPADRVILEITESSVMGDPEQTLPVLHKLRDLGVCISLDDFGTGYSSLSYLQRLPVGEVKIDRSFVQGLSGENRASTRALIKTIIGLGADLNLRIVAEGVEDQATMDELRGLGCQVAQGYYISRPISGPDLRTWLARREEAAPRLRLLSVGS